MILDHSHKPYVPRGLDRFGYAVVPLRNSSSITTGVWVRMLCGKLGAMCTHGG